MNATTFGLDLAKRVMQVHWVEGETGEICRRQLKRGQVLEFFARRAPAVIAMETCGSAHYWGRKLTALGHQVRLIAAQFVFHESMVDAWEAFREGAEAAFDPLVAAHVFGGILVGALMLWRLALRVTRGAPAAPAHEPQPLRIAAAVGHWAFYLIVLVMVASGLAAWFGGIGNAAEVHETLKPVLLLLVAVHGGAVVYHRGVLKQSVMQRLVRPG